MKSLKDFVQAALEYVPEVTPEETLARLTEPDLLLLDVREPDEFEAGHLPGAVNLPRGWVEVKVDLEHPKRDPSLADRERPVICYCGGGHRSALAARAMQEMGFTNVVSMAEGWTGWTKRGLPTS
jgi:rhodanese-related sulfurtransferase